MQSTNHSFDVAREGYLNLHLAQHKRSKNPGDSDQMMRSRQRFLNGGYYQTLADGIISGVKHKPRLGFQSNLCSTLAVERAITCSSCVTLQ